MSKRLIILSIFFLLFSTPLFFWQKNYLFSPIFAQTNTTTQQGSKAGNKDNTKFKEEDFAPIDMQLEIKKRLYPEIPLEDFENSQYGNEHIRFQYGETRYAELIMRTDYPAPILGSKRYLGIKVLGRREDAIQVYLPKPILIKEYVKQFNIWLYGKNLTGNFKMVIKDIKENTHVLNFGLLNFFGWKRVTVTVPPHVLQAYDRMTRKRGIRVISFIFNPGNLTEQSDWNYLYIDDLSATVFNKYTDRQSDEW